MVSIPAIWDSIVINSALSEDRVFFYFWIRHSQCLSMMTEKLNLLTHYSQNKYDFKPLH